MRPLFRRVTDRYFSRVISVAALQLTWRLLAGGMAIVTALLISVALGLATQGVVATSNSFLAGLILFQFGSGPVRGFAVTLCIGLVSSVFTAVVGTRVVYDYLLTYRRLQTVSV